MAQRSFARESTYSKNSIVRWRVRAISASDKLVTQIAKSFHVKEHRTDMFREVIDGKKEQGRAHYASLGEAFTLNEVPPSGPTPVYREVAIFKKFVGKCARLPRGLLATRSWLSMWYRNFLWDQKKTATTKVPFATTIMWSICKTFSKFQLVLISDFYDTL